MTIKWSLAVILVGSVCLSRACINKCRGLSTQGDFKCYSVGEEWSYNRCTYYICLYRNGLSYHTISQNGCKVDGRCHQNGESWQKSVGPGVCRNYRCEVSRDKQSIRYPSYVSTC